MKRTTLSIDLEPVQVTMGFWMSLSRALDAWARLQNAQAAKLMRPYDQTSAEEQIKAAFDAHPGAWRPDPENWFREGWIAGWNAAKEDTPND